MRLRRRNSILPVQDENPFGEPVRSGLARNVAAFVSLSAVAAALAFAVVHVLDSGPSAAPSVAVSASPSPVSPATPRIASSPPRAAGTVESASVSASAFMRLSSALSAKADAALPSSPTAPALNVALVAPPASIPVPVPVASAPAIALPPSTVSGPEVFPSTIPVREPAALVGLEPAGPAASPPEGRSALSPPGNQVEGPAEAALPGPQAPNPVAPPARVANTAPAPAAAREKAVRPAPRVARRALSREPETTGTLRRARPVIRPKPSQPNSAASANPAPVSLPDTLRPGSF